MVLNLLFAYSGRVCAIPTPTWMFRELRDVGSLTDSEDWGKELIEYLSLLHISCHQFSLLIYLGGVLSFAFSDLCINRITCNSLDPLPSPLAFLIPSLTHPKHIPDHLYLFPLPVNFLLTPEFEEQILVQPCQFLACLAWFPTYRDGEFLCSKKGALK